jgi:DNA invertase Pin-like site-specific DNA recombinase
MSEKRALRVGVWCAVSSAAQATPDKVSLADQEATGRAFAASVGGQVVAVYTVAGHSRDYVFYEEAARDMDAYRQLCEDAEAGRLDVLHILEMSRLGRDPALAQTAVSMLDKYGAEVYNAASPHVIGQRSIGTKFADAIQMVSAQEEQVKRVHRLRSGMRGRVRRGLFPGELPTGYRPLRNVQGETVGAEFDELIDAVRIATEMYVRGGSWLEIKDVLDRSPYRPPRSSKAKGWRVPTLRRWMHNDAYAGLPTWGKIQAEKPSKLYPALWDEGTYQSVLAERDRRRLLMPRSKTSAVLGIAFCARCKHRMHRGVGAGHPNGPYLRCGQHAYSSRSDLDVPPCHPNHIRERFVIRAIGEYMALVRDPGVLEELMVHGSPDNNAEMRLGEIERALGDYAQQRQRLALVLASGQMQPDIYADADEQIRLRVEQLQNEKARLARRKARRIPFETRYQAVAGVNDLLAGPYKVLPAAQVNVLLHRIGLRVYVEEGEIQDIDIYEDVS